MSMTTLSSRRAVLKASVALAAVATAGGVLAACGENKPAEPVVDANPIVETKYGKVKGALEDGIATFKGVRYGADTTLTRFQLPSPPEAWTETQDALGYATSAPEIAAETKVPVAIVDSPKALKAGLVADYTLSGHEGAYLAGRMAAKMSKSKHVGIVVSGEPPSWNSQSAGFAEGVKAESKDVKITYAVIGPAAYSDAAGGRRVTESVIAAGADIIFGQGNGSSFGMLQAVETTKTTAGGKALFIDVIGDKTSVGKGFLLSSVVWDITPVYSAMIKDLKDNTFGTKRYAIGLADNSVKLLKTDQIPDAVWADVQKLREDVVSGKIKVQPVFEATAVRALMTNVSAAAK